MKIKSITDLKLQNSFYQLNLIKGFKYVDKAGEIVNLYHNGNKPPEFNMGFKVRISFCVIKNNLTILWRRDIILVYQLII